MDNKFCELSTTAYGNVLSRNRFVDFTIHPLWDGVSRIAGPAYTVQLAAGDNLMLHAAIYEAPKNSIIVIDGVDTNYAVAGGNVCAIAKSRGILGFVIDGVIRDLEEIKSLYFPVFAKGIFPVPGKKKIYKEPAQPIVCGGAKVQTGDIVVADIEGIVFIPKNEAASVYERAKELTERENSLTLDEWQVEHRRKIEDAVLKSKNEGYQL
jgi:4-hydroxy-4-methyl-2-oxoglutarate aldolase